MRIRLVGIGTPTIILKTINRDLLLNAAEFHRSLPAEFLQMVFPRGTGIHLDFLHRDKIILRKEGSTIANLNGQPILENQEHHLTAGDIKKLEINGAEFRLDVLQSHF